MRLSWQKKVYVSDKTISSWEANRTEPNLEMLLELGEILEESIGYFIEIEVKKYNKSPLEEYDNLIKIAKSLNLNLNNIYKKGYPYNIIYND